jgi:dipicolinate synthase subunit B
MVSKEVQTVQTAQKERLTGIKIGVVLTGSHCTIEAVLPQIEKLKEEGAIIYPIVSYTINNTDNRFYKVADLMGFLKQVTDRPIINTIVGAEP